jgi:ABC-2 type transport system permease protein
MWPLIRKDLLRRWRSPVATLVMIAFPLFMSGALGSIYGGGGDEEAFPRIKVLVENQDEGGFLSEAIVGMLGQEEGQEYLEVVLVGQEGRTLMAEGEASALVVLPKDFTENVLNRKPAAIPIVLNPAEGIKPEIVVQGGEVLATYLDQTARLLGSELGTIQDMIEADEVPAAAKVGAVAGRITERVAGIQEYVFPPLVSIGSAKEKTAEKEDKLSGGGVFGYILVMTAVMALLMVAGRTMGDFFEEKNSGMLRRQAATPVPVAGIVGAKFLFSVVFGVLVMAILAVAGLTMHWIAPPRDPWAALLLGIAFNFAACGCLALIISLTRNEKQSGILSWLIIMGMSAMGGSMVPLEQLPGPMRSASPFTLNYWAIDGFSQVMFDQKGLGDILGNLGVLLGAGLVMGLIAHILLVRRFREMTP